MDFIGYAYSIKDLKDILNSVPEYYAVTVEVTDFTFSSPEVYKNESRQEIILK